MKKLRFIGILGLLLFAGTVQVFAGNETKTGTAGALEVLLPVGARGTAMGGATNSMLDGVEALNWNPAGLAGGWGESSVEAMFSHMDYIAINPPFVWVRRHCRDDGIVSRRHRAYFFAFLCDHRSDVRKSVDR